MENGEEMHSPTIGSVQPIDVTITQAYRAQSSTIGWDHFLCGRISVHWGQAYHLCHALRTQNTDPGQPT